MIKQLDLFAGVGAFALAGERHGVKSVMSVEIDKYACKVLRHNFPNMEVYNNDIRELRTDYVSEHHGKIDIITSGFPCTSYSIAGKRKGFDDPRTGDLFDQTLRFIHALKPKIFILENVKGLLNHEKGKTFGAMLTRMGELGCYDVQWQVLNSKDFGVPQNRERVYIVGSLRGECFRKIFPIRKNNEKYKVQRSSKKTSLEWVADFRNDEGLRIKKDLVSYTLLAQARQDGTAGQNIIKIKAKSMIRRLIPLECQRLQAFPDTWYDGLEMSDSQKYKQMGNSITVSVLEEIYKRIEL